MNLRDYIESAFAKMIKAAGEEDLPAMATLKTEMEARLARENDRLGDEWDDELRADTVALGHLIEETGAFIAKDGAAVAARAEAWKLMKATSDFIILTAKEWNAGRIDKIQKLLDTLEAVNRIEAELSDFGQRAEHHWIFSKLLSQLGSIRGHVTRLLESRRKPPEPPAA